MPDDDSQSKSRVVIGIVIFGIIGILVYTFVTGGFVSLRSFIYRVIQTVLIISALFLIVWIVVKLLQRPKVNLLTNNIKDIVESATLTKSPLMMDIYISGDKGHGSAKLGKIVGYAQIQTLRRKSDFLKGGSYKDMKELVMKNPDLAVEIFKNIKVGKLYEPERGMYLEYVTHPEDCFVFKKWRFPLSVFEPPKVLRCLEHEHSELVGDIDIFTVSIFKKYGFFWPSRRYLDMDTVDQAVVRDVFRGAYEQTLKDFVGFFDKASGLDQLHKKDVASRKLLKVPTVMDEEESRRMG